MNACEAHPQPLHWKVFLPLCDPPQSLRHRRRKCGCGEPSRDRTGVIVGALVLLR